MYKSVLFDMDGVLVNSFEAWLSLMNATAQHFGYPPVGRERFMELYGQPTRLDIQEFFPGESVADIEDYYQEHFGSYDYQVVAGEGAFDVIRELATIGATTAVVTNTPSGMAREILANLSLRTDIVIGGDDVENAKPYPDMLFKACKELGVKPNEALMIGDSIFDRDAAEAAEIDFVGLRMEYPGTILHLSDLIRIVIKGNP